MKHPNILIVDDEQDICTMFSKWFALKGYRVKSVLSGKEALELVGKKYFDVVFLDIVMPGVPAFEVLEKIKEISSETKVVVISGQLLDSHLIEAVQQRGASGLLQKPFKIEDILKHLPDRS